MNTQLKATNKQIDEYNAAIEKETKRLERDSESKREESQQRLNGARAAVAAAEEALKAIQDQKSSAEADLRRLKDAGAAADNRKNELRSSVTECETAVQNCLRADTDRYAAYGQNIQRVVQQINQANWHGEKPLGPFGVHVKVRDHQWAELLRFQLGQLLTSFAVTEARDLPQLKKILADNGK